MINLSQHQWIDLAQSALILILAVSLTLIVVQHARADRKRTMSIDYLIDCIDLLQAHADLLVERHVLTHHAAHAVATRPSVDLLACSCEEYPEVEEIDEREIDRYIV